MKALKQMPMGHSPSKEPGSEVTYTWLSEDSVSQGCENWPDIRKKREKRGYISNALNNALHISGPAFPPAN